MPKLTYIGRASDGLILCETYEDLLRESMELKNIAKSVLKKLHRAPDMCVLDTQLRHTFYYKIVDGVCFLTCTESQYPRKLAIAFLDEIISRFQEELKKKWGSGESIDVRSKIETIEQPYFFLSFDRVIRNLRQQYLSPSDDLADVHRSLEDVKHIMRLNVDAILERDKTISDIEAQAGSLKRKSADFASKSKKLNMSMWLRKYGLLIAIVAVLVFGLYYRFAL